MFRSYDHRFLLKLYIKTISDLLRYINFGAVAACGSVRCAVKQLKPNYINIKVNGRKPQDKKTTINAIKFRTNQEIKFLYCKKHNLNQQLHHLHLEGTHQYNGMWQHIQDVPLTKP